MLALPSAFLYRCLRKGSSRLILPASSGHDLAKRVGYQNFQLLRLLCVALLCDALVQVLIRQAQNGQPAPKHVLVNSLFHSCCSQMHACITISRIAWQSQVWGAYRGPGLRCSAEQERNHLLAVLLLNRSARFLGNIRDPAAMASSCSSADMLPNTLKCTNNPQMAQ